MKTLTWGIYLVVFCLPLYLVRFKIFGIPTTVLEILIYVLFVFWLIKGFGFGEFKKLLITHYSLLAAVILILIGVSLATIFSSDLRISAGIWKAWFIDPILFFIVLVSVIREKPAASQGKQAGPSKCGAFVGVLYSLFLSGTVVSIISLAYLILGKLDPVGRLQTFYTSPNYLAMYLAPALIIGFGLITRKNIISSTFILFSIICLVLSIIFTYSFGAWLGIVAALGFGFFIYLLKLKKRLAWVILGFSLVFILILGYLALIQRGASLETRLIIWQRAFEVFKTHPILGIGPGTFEGYPQPHNIFLAFLLQTGIVGFIGFIWLLIWFLKTGFMNLASFNDARFILILISMMIYILVHGLVDTTYWKNDLSALFWTVTALMVISKNRSIDE